MAQRKWKKPELTVLVRGRPEEAVLVNCKTSSSAMGPNHDAFYCDRKVNLNANCYSQPCSTVATT